VSGLLLSSFIFKKPAENYRVRECAPIKFVGAHDNFSAGYKNGIAHFNILYFNFSHRERHLTHSGI